MAYILIDGYNLLGIAHENLEKARDALIQRLCNYADLKGHNITIVFDGWKNGQMTETRMRIRNVNIVYSRLGEKADTVIKRILSEKGKPWIVVSSDREISDFAKTKNLVPLTSTEFEKKLDTRSDKELKIEQEDYIKDEDYFDMRPAHPKGNPRKPSKKQKQKLRTLKKL